MKIAVVGTGYVGLVSGTCFAETGNDVICVDIDQSKVDRLSNGQITIFEPGLEVLFKRNLKEGRLKFTANLEEAIKERIKRLLNANIVDVTPLTDSLDEELGIADPDPRLDPNPSIDEPRPDTEPT